MPHARDARGVTTIPKNPQEARVANKHRPATRYISSTKRVFNPRYPLPLLFHQSDLPFASDVKKTRSPKNTPVKWFKSSLTSIYGLLGKPVPPTEPASAEGMEAARKEMMQSMTETGLDQRHPTVFGKIAYADNIQALWYARSDLMAVLSAERGEVYAREKIAAVSGLFDGLLPSSFKYREPPR